ncbi:MAG: flagellar motor protein MotB [Fibrobacteria bacterium]|nr:flagellar motor protein MotB [Fibrobacteria bacterium]
MSKKCECPKGSPAYMTTFGDMMSLLLTFFVMLLSMASFEPLKYAMTVQSLQGAFGVLESFPTVAVLPIVRIPRFGDADQRRKQSQDDAQELQEKMKDESLEKAVKVKVTETGVAIMLSDAVTFQSGSAQLNPKALKALKPVSDIIDKYPNAMVRVEGHTDDVPIKTARYPSNWELSADRALRIVKILSKMSKIDPGSLSAVGYGEHRPLVPNLNEANRRKNRRIEIYIDYTKKQ